MEQLNKLLYCDGFINKIGHKKEDILAYYTQYLNESVNSISIINLYLFKKEIIKVIYNKNILNITKYPISLLSFKHMENIVEAKYCKSTDSIILDSIDESIKLGKEIDSIVKKPIKELENDWLEKYIEFNKKLYDLLLEIY